MQGDFVSDINRIRERARQHIEDGPVTDTYGHDRVTVLKLLNEALATELVCILRYKQHYYMAETMFAETVAAAFLEHAQDEQKHADMIAERITQLGGVPDFNPQGLITRSASEYTAGTAEELLPMIEENLIAERIAIQTYTEMIRYLGEGDPTTRRMFEDILKDEEDHADELQSMITHMGNITKGRGS
jgi:bacterioferritin